MMRKNKRRLNFTKFLEIKITSIKNRSTQNRSPTRSTPIDRYLFLTDCHHFHIEKKSKNDKSLKACNFLNNAPIFNPEKVLESS